MSNVETRIDHDTHRDPITGAPGAHPVGTGVGAAIGGAAAGAVAGTMAGPVGTVLGAAVGAIAGGLAGKGIAESIDPTAENAFWRENYRSRPYAEEDFDYGDYGPAYRYGVDSFIQYPGQRFEDIEPELSRDWDNQRGTSSLDWERAKDASRDAWNRVSDSVERAMPGDSDRDGK